MKELWTNIVLLWKALLEWRDLFLNARAMILPWGNIDLKIGDIIGFFVGIGILWRIVKRIIDY